MNRGLLTLLTTLSVFLLAISFTCVESSAEAPEKRPLKTWQGYLIDRLCMKAAKDFGDPTDYLASHNKDCLDMSRCKGSGFALYSKKHWHLLDKAGNKMVEDLLNKSDDSSHFFVRVTGTLKKKNFIAVKKITRITAKQSEKDGKKKSESKDKPQVSH